MWGKYIRYVKAALSSIVVSSEQLVPNVAERLRDDVKSVKLVPWPPRVEQLEEEEELSPLIVQLLPAVQEEKGVVDLSPSTLSLASLITQYIVQRPTTTAISATVTLHGITRSLFNQVETSVMADYWRDFWSMTDALMQNVHAVHICNWDEYMSALCVPCYHGW